MRKGLTGREKYVNGCTIGQKIKDIKKGRGLLCLSIFIVFTSSFTIATLHTVFTK